MSAPMDLGELLDALTSMPHDAPVVYVGAGLDGQSPGDFDSWRGVYALLALGHGDTPCTVRDLLARAHDANGATYEGHKGGSNYMDRSTTIHVDNWGRWSERYLAAVRLLRGVKGDVVRLVVEEGEDW